MNQEKIQDTALMRYAVIAPLISGLQDEFSSHEAFFRDASDKGVLAPDGTTRHFAPATIQKWYNLYHCGGCNALLPSPRADIGKLRKLDEDLQEQIRHLKTNCPRSIPLSVLVFMSLFASGSL